MTRSPLSLPSPMTLSVGMMMVVLMLLLLLFRNSWREQFEQKAFKIGLSRLRYGDFEIMDIEC